MAERKKGARRPRPRTPPKPSVHFDDGEMGDDRDPRLPARGERDGAERHGQRRLFTATAAIVYEHSVMLVFHASMASEAREVRSLLCKRFGELGAGLARINEGYNERDFLARTVVAPALRLLLRDVEENPYGIAADGFDVTHMQTVGVDPRF